MSVPQNVATAPEVRKELPSTIYTSVHPKELSHGILSYFARVKITFKFKKSLKIVAY